MMHSGMRQSVKRQISDKAETIDEAVVTQAWTRCKLPMSRTRHRHRIGPSKALIRREDIASLAQEVVRYLGAVNSTAVTLRQDSTERPTVTTTYHHE